MVMAAIPALTKKEKLQALEKVQTKGQQQGSEQRSQAEQPVKSVQL